MKADNAEAAGAAGVVIFNQGDPRLPGTARGTLGDTGGMPVVGASYALGAELAARRADGSR